MARLRGEAARRKWRELIAEQERSGETVAAFCRERRMCAPQFFWWRRRLREGDASGFVEVKRPPTPELPRLPELEVRLRGGRSLALRPGVDLAWVREVAAALEAGE